MKRSTLISVTLASLILISISAAAPQVQAQRQLTLTTYAAKFVCGKSDQKIASPGQYFTMINVHNPSPFNRAVYIKRFAIALPEERPGKISNFAGGILGPDEAMTIDCENIYKHTEVPPGQFLEGFALIYALTELDVVGVVEKVSMNIQKTCSNYIAKITTAFNETKRVVVELPHHAQNEVTLWPWR